MKKYVVGFAFTEDYSKVVLIHKTRGPEYVRGKLNGIGGKVEPNETTLEAMVREFKEETDYHGFINWRLFATYTGTHNDSDIGFEIDFFEAAHFDVNDAAIMCLSTPMDDDEEIYIADVDSFAYHNNVVPNLKWLIPMAQDGTYLRIIE